MRVGTIIQLTVASVFLIIALCSDYGAWQEWRQLHRYREATVLRLPVDLSITGTEYRGNVRHIWRHSHHGVSLRLETSRRFTSFESARRALEGAEISVTVRRVRDREPIERVFNDCNLWEFPAGSGRFVPVYPMLRGFSECGTYPLMVKVIKPASALKGVPQTLVGFYEGCPADYALICGNMMGAGVFGLVAALLGVPVLLRYRRARGGDR